MSVVEHRDAAVGQPSGGPGGPAEQRGLGRRRRRCAGRPRTRPRRSRARRAARTRGRRRGPCRARTLSMATPSGRSTTPSWRSTAISRHGPGSRPAAARRAGGRAPARAGAEPACAGPCGSRRPRARRPACRRPGRVRRAASATAAVSSASSSLTGTRSRGSAFSRESSLPGSKRVKRSCHASSRRRACAPASTGGPSGPSPPAWTAHSSPKQGKRVAISFMPAPPVAEAGARRNAQEGDPGHRRRDHPEQEPGGARVRAHAERVPDHEQPGERGEAVQRPPAGDPDRPART